jgi:hypothetical protein
MKRERTNYSNKVIKRWKDGALVFRGVTQIFNETNHELTC